jgi:hypothetical protein
MTAMKSYAINIMTLKFPDACTAYGWLMTLMDYSSSSVSHQTSNLLSSTGDLVTNLSVLLIGVALSNAYHFVLISVSNLRDMNATPSS